MKWIYFIKVDDKFFKIGIARNVKKRLSQHESSLTGKHNIEFLAAVKGSVGDENNLHRYFQRHAAADKTELFVLCPEVAEYIRWLRDLYFVAVSEDDINDSFPCTTYDMWGPTPERRKAPPRNLLTNQYEFLPREITGDDFYTPEWIIGCARMAMGGIDLDPASHPVANSIVKATRFFTLHDNGLEHRWKGRVWLNPPFSQWDKWVKKVVKERESVEQFCIYVATRTLTANYFQPLLSITDAICIVTGRHANWGPRATPSPDDGHCVLYLGTRIRLFCDSFEGKGVTFNTTRNLS